MVALATAVFTLLGAVVAWWLGEERRLAREKMQRERRILDALDKADELADAVDRGNLADIERLQRERMQGDPGFGPSK